DIEWADEMEAWKVDKDNKKKSKAGDDRTPAHRWLGSLYHDGKLVIIPTDNIMRALMEGGAQVLVPGALRGKTFKAQTQSGIIPRGTGWPLVINGDEEPLPVAPILELKDVADFAAHKAKAQAMGFSLFVKRAKIGATKHIRVRPRFEVWR